MKIYFKFFILGACLFIASCSASLSCKVDSKPAKNIPRTYTQDFKTDVAWVVVEWNGKPVNGGWGSAFLIDKENGAFYTNKHVANMFNSNGKGSHKIFFNGKVYNAEVVKVPPLRDAAVFRITDEFDPSEFPEPAPFATEKVKKGDKVFIDGFHPHPYSIIESDQEENYDQIITNIWEVYYNLHTLRADERKEVVFEKMTAKVIEINSSISFDDAKEFIDDVKELSNNYTIVITDKNHKFPFGGLSGTVVRNARGEVVGMVTLEKSHFIPDQKEIEKMKDGKAYVKRVYDTIGFTPIESIANLRDYLGRK